MRILKSLLPVVLAAALPVSASAATITSYGPRVGLSLDPDQLVIGGQLNTSEIAKDFTLNPNLEIGFGDDVSVVAANLEGQYHFRIQGSDWRPYLGVGLGINFVSVDLPPPYSDESDTDIGLNLALGTAVPTGGGHPMFGELRFIVGDSNLPSLKIMFGMNFGR